MPINLTSRRLPERVMIVTVALVLMGPGSVAEHAGHARLGGDQSFEVASVRPNKSTAASMFPASVQTRPDGSVVAVDVSLNQLIGFAYRIDGIYKTIEGGSNLLREHFDVTTKVAEPVRRAPDGEVGPTNVMMQNLLAERFKLVLRWEDRPQAGYALVRLKPDGSLGAGIRSTNRDCSNPTTYREKPPGDTRGCAITTINGELNAAGHRMGDFARFLSRSLRRPVLDQTELLGLYDIQMTFNASELLRSRGGILPLPPEPLRDASNPSVFTALQEQLGLKLEQQRVTVSTLIVEHVEAPSEN